MPQVGDYWESYRSDEFVLIIGNEPSPSVTKVSGLNQGTFDTIEQPDGASSHVYKISSTKVKFEPLTIERNVDGSEDDKRFQEWFKSAFKLNTTKPKGSAIRRNGRIQKIHNGDVVMEFAFFGAWIKSMSFGDLEAGATNLWKQTIVLEHEGLELVE